MMPMMGYLMTGSEGESGAGQSDSKLLQEDGASLILLEDGSGYLLLE